MVKTKVSVRDSGVGFPQTCFQEKALEIARLFETTDFKASDGWLTRFKVRHAITFKRIHGEAAEIDQEELRDWQLNVLQPVIEQYAPKDIYNLDETGLFYQLLPKWTMSFRGESNFFYKIFRRAMHDWQTQQSSRYCVIMHEHGWKRQASDTHYRKVFVSAMFQRTIGANCV